VAQLPTARISMVRWNVHGKSGSQISVKYKLKIILSYGVMGMQ